MRRACTRSPPCRASGRSSAATSRATSCPRARELGIALVAYSPLGRGLLTGAASAHADLADDDFRRTLPRWQAENLDANLALVRRIREIATEVDAQPSQVVLAWLLAQGDDVVPIPGTKRRTYLDENREAVRVRLTDDAIATA